MLSRKKFSVVALGLLLLQGVHATEYVQLEATSCYVPGDLSSVGREIQTLHGEGLIQYLAGFTSDKRGGYTLLSSKDKKALLKSLRRGQNQPLILLNKAAAEGDKEAKQFIIRLIWDNAAKFSDVNWFQGALSTMANVKFQSGSWLETIKKFEINFGLDREAITNNFDVSRECLSYTFIDTLILNHSELLYDICVDYLYQKSQEPKKSRFKLLFRKASSSAQPKFNRKETQFYKFSQVINPVIAREDSLLLMRLVNTGFDSASYSNRYSQTQSQVKSFLKALPYVKD
ncbi:MAG: hypothetical protein K0M45_09825 [Candidatus Paracaedibacteraceae bacterium]|nr:hypothetical protein [Candidatus Paracaedibacteraceae bacterium]